MRRPLRGRRDYRLFAFGGARRGNRLELSEFRRKKQLGANDAE